MQVPYKVLFVVLHLLLLPLTLTFLLLLLLYKQFVLLLAKLFQNFVSSIPSSSYMFISDDIWGQPTASIVAALQLQGHCSKDDISKLFQQTYDLRDKESKRYYRELGYYPVHYCGHGFWKRVENFKISSQYTIPDTLSFHLDILSYNYTGTESSLATFLPPIIEMIQRQPYEKKKPLWDVFLVHNNCSKDDPHYGTLVILRFHHLMADGMSIVKFFYALTGSQKLPETFTKPSSSMTKWNQLANSGVLTKIVTFCSLFTIGVVEYFHQVAIQQDKTPLNFSDNRQLKLTGKWMCTVGRKMNVDELKKASKRFHCSIVHIILKAISSALNKYFIAYHGNETLPSGYHYFAALPLPGHPDLRFVNHWCFSKLHSRMDVKNIEEEIGYFKEETKRCATTAFPILSAFFLKFVCGLIPSKLIDLTWSMTSRSTVGLSNVVGPQEEDRLIAGSKVNDIMFWIPLLQKILGLAAATISCNGGLRVCITADTRCIPTRNQLEMLARMIDEELLNICNMA